MEIEGLKAIANTCDVATEGVKGAKGFFEAKVQKVRRLMNGSSILTAILVGISAHPPPFSLFT